MEVENGCLPLDRLKFLRCPKREVIQTLLWSPGDDGEGEAGWGERVTLSEHLREAVDESRN